MHTDENYQNSVACPECGHEFHRFGHLQSFDEKRITELLRNHGFKISFLKIYAMGAMVKNSNGQVHPLHIQKDEI